MLSLNDDARADYENFSNTASKFQYIVCLYYTRYINNILLIYTPFTKLQKLSHSLKPINISLQLFLIFKIHFIVEVVRASEDVLLKRKR